MRQLSPSHQTIGLIGWLLLTFAASGIGAAATISAAPFYAQLVRPDWAPPSSIFGPVWTALYFLMGLSAWLVWRQRSVRRTPSVFMFYFAQLILNALWSWLFFAWHRGALATVDIVVLWLLIVANIIVFWRVKPLAGVLLLPYLAWVSFASYLCYTIWQLNPTQL